MPEKLNIFINYIKLYDNTFYDDIKELNDYSIRALAMRCTDYMTF